MYFYVIMMSLCQTKEGFVKSVVTLCCWLMINPLLMQYSVYLQYIIMYVLQNE